MALVITYFIQFQSIFIISNYLPIWYNCITVIVDYQFQFYNNIITMKNVQKTGFASTRTPKPTKQNLSTSSILQNHKVTKSKVYVSSNRFSLLATNDNYDITTAMYLTKSTKPTSRMIQWTSLALNMGLPAPLIHVKNISNYSAFSKVLTNITDQNGFTCKTTLSRIIIQPAVTKTWNYRSLTRN